MLIATNKPAQLQGHLGRALSNGVQPIEASGVLTHLALYCGWPTAVSALDVYEQVYTSGNVDLASLRAALETLPVPAWEADRSRSASEQFGTIASKFTELTTDVVDDDQLDFYLRRAVERGLTRDQITEAFTHLALYAGWAKATKAITATARVLGTAPSPPR